MENILDNLVHTFIAPSATHGYGLYAATFIKKGSVLGTLDGQIMNWDYYDHVRDALALPPKARDYLFLEWNALAPDTLLVRPFRTKYSYINHARIPNVEVRSRPLEVVALRDIERGEELLLDYRKEPLSHEYLTGHGSTYL